MKSFSAHEINRQRARKGAVWQDEYFDRIIRNDDEFYEKFNYMIQNPVKTGLVESAEAYSFTYRPGDDLGPHGRDARATDGNGDAMHRQDACATESSSQDGDSELKFFPARYAKTFQAWHENLRDWCISRQLWWGHRIPVWSAALRAEGVVNDMHGDVGDFEGRLRTWEGAGRISIVRREAPENVESQEDLDQMECHQWQVYGR
ncbi:MAG: class I tRNA ligase family protein, partial [Planctomycetes bacterium]|nr:class I tRNA ligase family protein [Planctomycetota bacterium]